MSIRAFRRLPWAARRKWIDQVDDPLTRQIMEVVFLGPRRVSWAKAACMIGGGNSPETIRKRVFRELHRQRPEAKAVPF